MKNRIYYNSKIQVEKNKKTKTPYTNMGFLKMKNNIEIDPRK